MRVITFATTTLLGCLLSIHISMCVATPISARSSTTIPTQISTQISARSPNPDLLTPTGALRRRNTPTHQLTWVNRGKHGKKLEGVLAQLAEKAVIEAIQKFRPQLHPPTFFAGSPTEEIRGKPGSVGGKIWFRFAPGGGEGAGGEEFHGYVIMPNKLKAAMVQVFDSMGHPVHQQEIAPGPPPAGNE
ncbi:hypothetical protein BDP27DRAFT_1454912 [Rhodocollybia butyracea]|uniref:Uncharacterized protein n=1 Tax=Rhodocollybia butyracea TaxID=206335 RepID=A0A9P5TXR0_9AGAR|nr:hypothetical protein BDP27DRAFT_1454912 [Rhodocollybia butyracea]